MTILFADGYISDDVRTEGEVKVAFEDQRDFIAQLPGAGVEAVLTLVAGQVTAAAFAHQIDTEAAASTDDFTHLLQNNLPNGSLVLLRNVASGRTVVVKHAAGGTGQLILRTSTDFSLLDPREYLLLKRVGTQWEEVDRMRLADAFPGGAATGFRVPLDLDAAPTGWTRDTGIDDRLMNLVSGARVHGGSWTITGLTMPHVHGIPHTHNTLRDGWGRIATGVSVSGRIRVGDGVTDPTPGDAANDNPSGPSSAANSDGASTATVVSDGAWRPLRRDMILVYPAN